MDMFENATRTELSELGEFELIRALTQHIQLKNKSTIKGVGDDAAVLDAEGKQMLVSSDMFCEGIHFDLTYFPLKHLGYKAVVANLSDIIAMNGTPKQIIVSISASNRFSLESLEELYRGIYLACDKYGVDVVGGDTSSSRLGLIISITAIGQVAKDDVVYRNTAKRNDLICVSGDLGGAYAGLLMLEREKKVFEANPKTQPDLEGYSYVLERQLKPELRIDVIEKLRSLGIKPTSMMDISDGLSSELFHICRSSKCGCVVFENKIPLDSMTDDIAHQFAIVPSTFAMSGGEDYELLFTIKPTDYEKIKGDLDISVIGYITEEKDGLIMITPDKHQIELKAQGWEGSKLQTQQPIDDENANVEETEQA